MIEALQYEFMRNALVAGILASVVCGIIGVYVVVNRMVFISGGISHSAFGGVGMSFFLGINPVLGALVFAMASAFGIGAIRLKTKVPEDTAIGILWATGMAMGVIFIGLTPGYFPELSSYLFGNILLVSSNDLTIMLVLVGIIVSTVFALYKGFFALSFDEEFGAIRGLPIRFFYFLLLCLIALSVIILMRAVGIILVIALLTIPVAIAKQFTYDMKRMMLFSMLLSLVLTVSGLWISYELNLATGATIILVAAVVFLITTALKKTAQLYRILGEV